MVTRFTVRFYLFALFNVERVYVIFYISILIIPCIIYYVTNKETLNSTSTTLLILHVNNI